MATPILFWYWWILALILLGLELTISGFFCLWLALAAFFTGCWVFILPIVSAEIQVLVFSIISIFSVGLWRFYIKRHPLNLVSDQPLLNKRGAQYIGRTFTLIEAITNGQGKIKVDDTLWKVQGQDAPINTKVRVTAIRGTVFEVEQLESPQ